MSREFELTVIHPRDADGRGMPRTTRWARYASAENAIKAGEKLLAKPYGDGDCYCVTAVGFVVADAGDGWKAVHRAYRRTLRVKDNGCYAKLFLAGGEADVKKWTMFDDRPADER